MIHDVIQWFLQTLSWLPPEAAVFVVSMIPLLEQRVGLPLAIVVYQMPPLKALLITFVGNIIPVLILLFHADRFHEWVKKNSGTFFGRKWVKKLAQAQDSFKKFEKYGLIGLSIFIISPLPGSGIFTGALLAFLMGIPFKHSWPYITVAVMGSAIVTMLISMGLGAAIY